jgi:hypothetical protein
VKKNVRIAKRDERLRHMLLRLGQILFLFSAVLFLIAFLFWGIITVFAAGSIELPIWLAPVVSVASLAAPVTAACRVLVNAWIAMLKPEPPPEANGAESTRGEDADALPMVAANEALEYKNPLDPYSLTKQRAWRTALGVRTVDCANVLVEEDSRWRAAAILIGAGLSLTLIVLDVLREVDMRRVDAERQAYFDDAIDYVRWNEVNWNGIPEVANWTPDIPEIRLRTLRPWASVLMLLVRVLFVGFSLPFVAAMNLAVVYTRWKCLPKWLKGLKITGQILLLLVVILAFVGLGVEKTTAKPAFTGYEYVGPTGRVTESAPAAMCLNKLHEWDLVSLAGIQLVLEAVPDEAYVAYDDTQVDWLRNNYSVQTSSVDWETVEWTDTSLLEPAEAIWRTVFGFDEYPVPLDEAPDCPEVLTVNNTCRVFPYYFIGERYFIHDARGGMRGGGVNSRRGSRDYVAFATASNRGEEVGLLVENVVAYWFRTVMQGLIPVFRLVDDFFLSRFLSDITEGLVTAVLGGDRLSTELAAEWETAFATIRLWHSVSEFEDRLARSSEKEQVEADADPTMNIVVGHSAGGLIAKALALKIGWLGVAYESPQLERSPVSGLFGQVDDALRHNLLNLFSGSTLLATHETRAKTNVILPAWQKLWAPATHAQTFCLAAAGCAMDDRYDALCEQLVGKEQFRAYFKSWNRTRTDE